MARDHEDDAEERHGAQRVKRGRQVPLAARRPERIDEPAGIERDQDVGERRQRDAAGDEATSGRSSRQLTR